MKLGKLEIKINNDRKEKGLDDLTHYLNYQTVPFSSILSNVRGEGALKLSAVYRGVDLISDSIASLPLLPYKRLDSGLWEPSLEHPTTNLLNIEPNPLYSRFDMLKTVVMHMIIKGNAYVYILRDRNGMPIKQTILNPDKITVVKSENVDELRYLHDDLDGYLSQENVIHLFNFTENGWYGTSVLEYANKTLEIAKASENSAYSHFESGGQVNLLISAPEVGAGKIKGSDIRAQWENQFDQTKQNKHTVAFMPFDLKATPLSIEPAKSQLLESRKFNIDDIARFLKLKSSHLNGDHTTTYNNREQDTLEFLNFTLRPYLEKIELNYNRKFYPPSVRRTLQIRFDEKEIYRADSKTQAEYLDLLLSGGIITPNEARRVLNRPPIEGGDELQVKSGNQLLSAIINQSETNGDDTKHHSKRGRKR